MPQLQENVSLRSLHTFGLDVTARWMLSIGSESDLIEFLADNRFNQVPILILGGGSNVLFRNNYEGVLIRNEIKGVEVIEESDEEILVKVGAGENWHQFVLYALEQGWYGIENLSLIPGTIGAAPIQNIGAYGVELKEVFDHLEAIHRQTFQPAIFSREECQFGYRDSIFKREAKGKYVITRVILRLSKIPNPTLSYGALQKEIADIPSPTPRDVSEAVIQIRQSKLPDPTVIGNAGSFFKNPEISRSLFEKIQSAYPDVPSYPISDEIVKVPAGWLIETTGWKGIRRGEYGVHARQALVLVNYGNAKGSDIYDLSSEILESVQQEFGIMLEREVQVVG